VVLLWKMICNLEDPMSLRHPVEDKFHLCPKHKCRTLFFLKKSYAATVTAELVLQLYQERTQVACIWMSDGTRMNESCHSYEWVMSHVNESFNTCEWVASCHIDSACWGWWFAIGNESWHTCEWVMSHIWTSHVTHVNESPHIDSTCWG